jgi:hypothetical protein
VFVYRLAVCSYQTEPQFWRSSTIGAAREATARAAVRRSFLVIVVLIEAAVQAVFNK